MVDQSVGGAEEFGLHKMSREAMNPFFSPKSVLGPEALMTAKSNQLIAILDEAARSQEPLNLSDIFFALSNDIVRSFGADNGLLDDLLEANKQRKNSARLLAGVNFNKHFPWVQRGLGKLLPSIMGERQYHQLQWICTYTDGPNG